MDNGTLIVYRNINYIAYIDRGGSMNSTFMTLETFSMLILVNSSKKEEAK